MTILSDHLNRLHTEKILLVEIDPTGTPIYLSDTAYYTEPGDTPPNQPYIPVISPGGVPRLARKIQEVFGGRSVPTWGPLILAESIVGNIDLNKAALRNTAMRVLLTGPRSIIPHDQLAVVTDGIIGRRSGNPDTGITFEILDKQADFDNVELPNNHYIGNESANFPTSNIGKAIPLCLGRCRNITPLPIDTVNLIYQVNDGPVQDIPAAYDNGIALTKVASNPQPGQFSVNAASGTLQLGVKPTGILTCDCDGMLDGPTWLSTTPQIIDWLSRFYGGLAQQDIDITGLPTGIVGIYIKDHVTLSTVITSLMQGVLGWWGFKRQSQLIARIFDLPLAGGPSFDETRQLSDVKWREERNLHWAVPTLYRRNWTRNSQPASAVDVDTAAWLNSDGYDARVELSAIPSGSSVSKRIDTYFDNKADSDAVAMRALDLFGSERRRTTVTVPFIDPPIELGSSANLIDTGVLDGDHVVVGIVDRWDGEIPTVELELWG